jgi:predicted DNA-binding ribbon-helix-helix protein
MELILTSIAGTVILLVVQLLEFVDRDREHTSELASRIRAIPRLLTDSETLTATVPVAAAYGR